MYRMSLKPYEFMGALVAAMLIITGGAGIVAPEMYNAVLQNAALRAGLPVQDFASLIAGILLPFAIYYAHRGSMRAYILWTGLLIYAAYYYAFYCFGYIYTVFYPMYLAIMGLSLYSLIGLFVGIQQEQFARCADARMPVRFIAFVLAMPLLLVPIWGLGIYKGISTQQAGAADLVFVLDLTILIPAMTIAAVQIWNRNALGYQIGGALLIKAAISGLLLTAGSLLQVAKGFSIGPDFAMYVFLLVAGVTGLLLYMKHLHEPVVNSASWVAHPSESQPN